ncbi:hypothetical protein ABKN59_006342 [Abortiporus biennis]
MSRKLSGSPRIRLSGSESFTLAMFSTCQGLLLQCLRALTKFEISYIHFFPQLSNVLAQTAHQRDKSWWTVELSVHVLVFLHLMI